MKLQMLLPLFSCAIVFGQTTSTVKTANILVDASRLEQGSIVKYQLSGKLVSFANRDTLTAGKSLAPTGVDGKIKDNNADFSEIVQSKDVHSETLGLANDHAVYSHKIHFKMSKESENRTDLIIAIPITYSIYNKDGELVKTSTTTLHSKNKNAKIVFTEVGLNKEGKKNIRIFIDDPSINMSTVKVIQKR